MLRLAPFLAIALMGSAQAGPIPFPNKPGFVRAVWGDGADRLYLVASAAERGPRSLIECQRGAAPRVIALPELGIGYEAIGMLGRGVGASADAGFPRRGKSHGCAACRQ